MRQVVEPQSWLDVGAGHGHFCFVARQTLPGTRFEGLDLSEGIEEAARAGWIAAGYRGFFPDLAPSLEDRYDAVSMFHYLEHTPDVRRELRAARTMLKPGGFLVIEVPDPECPTARFLGRFWLPWLQPQHLNLMSMSVLERVLREIGFEPALSQRAEADRRHDLACAVGLLINFIAPPAELPWRPRPKLWRRLWPLMVRPLAAPLVLVGALADRLSRPLMRRRNRANGYRIVARSLKPAKAPEMAATPEAVTAPEAAALS